MAGARPRRHHASFCSRAKPRASTRTCAQLAWLGLALLLASAHGPVQAEASPTVTRDNPLTRWLPTPEARAAREQARLESALERLLQALPGVERVRASVSLPQADLVPLDRALPPAQATLVVLARADGPDAAHLEALARGVLPQRALVHVARSEVPARPSQRSGPARVAPAVATRVGPFGVEARSAGWLRVTLAALLASNALLAGLLLARRARR